MRLHTADSKAEKLENFNRFRFSTAITSYFIFSYDYKYEKHCTEILIFFERL